MRERQPGWSPSAITTWNPYSIMRSAWSRARALVGYTNTAGLSPRCSTAARAASVLPAPIPAVSSTFASRSRSTVSTWWV